MRSTSCRAAPLLRMLRIETPLLRMLPTGTGIGTRCPSLILSNEDRACPGGGSHVSVTGDAHLARREPSGNPSWSIYQPRKTATYLRSENSTPTPLPPTPFPLMPHLRVTAIPANDRGFRGDEDCTCIARCACAGSGI